MNEPDKQQHGRKPEVEEKDEVGKHPQRSPSEFGTHEGGKHRPPNGAGQVHGDPPRDLPNTKNR